MNDAQTKSHAALPAPGTTAAAEMKTAMAGFLDDFKGFQSDIKTRLTEQDTRIAMLDRKSSASRRAPLSHAAELDLTHKKAFAAYVRNGEEEALRGLEVEEKALSTTTLAEGGYLVDEQTAEAVQSVLCGAASLRAVANVVNVEATAYDVLVDFTDMGAGWNGETTVSETGTPSIERISIPLHELSALPKASQRLLDDAAFDIEGWLAARIADKFSRAESVAFISGDGVDKPRGCLNYPRVPNATWSWGNLGYVATGEAGDFAATDPADAIVDLVYALGAQYRNQATFVMNSKTAGAVRKMKDADGRFLWSDSLPAGDPARLMGYPVLIVEDMPDIATDTMAIAFGDFGAGYTVAERPDLRILRDPFSAKPHVLFFATKRVGGDVTDFAAIKLLKFGTS